eukprot:TRINITY_DN2248_c0_g1_i1.p1 TRINITY_DN2248_c0_g1~~TRINITY_DN2248_c0_g1_i1.p1  ORF type:complete len:530 (-),score=113.58 TRINITY_DN2248_c0_g1_i1:81-1670(-)
MEQHLKDALVRGDEQKVLEILANNTIPKFKILDQFFQYCRSDNANIVNIFLKAPQFDVNSFYLNYQNGMTALHASVEKNRPKIVKILLENRADVNAKIKKGMNEGKTALELSELLKFHEVKSVILNHLNTTLSQENSNLKNSSTGAGGSIETPKSVVENSDDQQIKKLKETIQDLKKEKKELKKELIEANSKLTQLTRSSDMLDSDPLKKEEGWVDLIKEFKKTAPQSALLELLVLSRNPVLPWRIPHRLWRSHHWEIKDDHYKKAELKCDTPEYKQVAELFYQGGIKNTKTVSLQLEKIEIIDNQTVENRFDTQLVKFDRQRANKDFSKTDQFRPSQIQYLNERLKPRFVPSGLPRANALLAWHGCSKEYLKDIFSDGMKDLRKTDGGYFASGVYLTFQSEYAAYYSSKCSELDIRANPGDTESLFVMVLCWVAVSHSYVVTREKPDYLNPDDLADMSVFNCSFPDGVRSDKRMHPSFDSHFIPIAQDNNYEASKIEDVPDYDELVVDSVDQVLPRYVVHFRFKKPQP